MLLDTCLWSRPELASFLLLNYGCVTLQTSCPFIRTISDIETISKGKTCSAKCRSHPILPCMPRYHNPNHIRIQLYVGYLPHNQSTFSQCLQASPDLPCIAHRNSTPNNQSRQRTRLQCDDIARAFRHPAEIDCRSARDSLANQSLAVYVQ